MNMTEEPVQSPCIKNCEINNEKICTGCFRSTAEIAQWSKMEDRMRLDVLDKVEKRRKIYDLKGP